MLSRRAGGRWCEARAMEREEDSSKEAEEVAKEDGRRPESAVSNVAILR